MTMTVLSFALFLAGTFGVLTVFGANNHYDGRKHYSGYSVFRIQPKSLEQLQILKNLSDFEEFDFWTLSADTDGFADVLVPPSRQDYFDQLLQSFSLSASTLIPDLESEIMSESVEIRSAELIAEKPALRNLNSYQRYANIQSGLSRLAEENPQVVSLQSIGRTSEGRNMRLVKIGKGTRKPIIFIDAGFHAREWVAPATALYIINDLVNNYQKRSSLRTLLNQFEFHILPVANPDGYEYSHTSDRMWRKTRSGSGRQCRGVDPNRNFGFHWNEVGASKNPCHETYAGPKAFSEPETKAIANYLNQQSKRIKAYLTLHSYGQLFLYPWGYTNKVTKDDNQLNSKAKIAANAIRRPYGTQYRVGTSTRVLYAAAGGSDDYAYGVSGIPYSYTIELRDSGKHGFLLPATLIRPTAEETWQGIQALAAAIGNELAFDR